MPTTIAITPRAPTPTISSGLPSMMESRDFTAVTTFSSAGLLLTICLAVLFLLSNHWIALSVASF